MRLPPPAGGALRVGSFRRTVSDLGRSIDFYCTGLGFSADRNDESDEAKLFETSARSEPLRSARLTLGEQTLELIAPIGAERHAGEERLGESVADAGFQHFAIVTRDMNEALGRLRHFAPRPISRGGAARLPAASGGATAFKFRDPDGHPLELIAFAAGTGDPRWHEAGGDAPTLGIDHTALSVRDVAASLAFYEQELGLALVARQTNRGPAQDALDGVDGAVVEVIALAPGAASTPHIELLGYASPVPRAPPRREPLLADHGDRTELLVADLRSLAERLAVPPRGAAGAAADLQDAAFIDGGAVLLRDPDGHLLVLRQTPR
ncbi:MAG: VOC family protein [Caldimonas sp.]